MTNFKTYFLGFMTAVLIGSLCLNVYLYKSCGGNPLEVGYMDEQRERLTDLMGK